MFAFRNIYCRWPNEAFLAQTGKIGTSTDLTKHIPQPHFVHCTATKEHATMHVVRTGGSEQKMATD